MKLPLLRPMKTPFHDALKKRLRAISSEPVIVMKKCSDGTYVMDRVIFEARIFFDRG